jgi:H+/gluconate symporter-like permease
VFDSDLCYGFLLGFLTAGVLGFIFQQLRMLNKKAGAADRKVAEVETKKSAREVYRTSARAKIERVIWFILLIVVAVGAAILLVYLS